MQDIVLDFDDFCEERKSLPLLLELKRIIPELKVNLFTILGLCSQDWVTWVQSRYGEWMDLIPHGWNHTRFECSQMSQEAAFSLLDRVSYFGLTKGFKSPQWRSSPGMYAALLARGYWLADLPMFDVVRPAGLEVYVLEDDSQLRVHGHMGPVRACNGIEQKWDYYASLKGNFKFIREIM